MMDTIIHIENDNYIGRTKFTARLLKDAITLAVKDVNGVARLGHKVKLDSNDGVKIYGEEEGLVVNIELCVEYGYTVADVSYRVQETVISVAAQFTNRKIIQVNIKVIGTKVTKKSEEINKRKKRAAEALKENEKEKENGAGNK
jgi:uncharacterized alkaline shock family protein YloU